MMTKMANLQSTISISTLAFIFLLFITITNQPSSARTLINSHHTHTHHHHKITFLMTNLLNLTHPSSKPATSKLTHDHQLPFSKPIGLFPPIGGVHIPETNPSTPTSGSSSSSSSQTLDLSGIGFSFPAKATLQELEFGIVTVIEEDVYKASKGGSFQKLGRAQGMYVASSENGSSHMMAMMVSFGNGDDGEDEDGLRFFGMHRTDVIESHIAVIGGTGKFNGANGYATVKAMSVKSNSNTNGEEEQAGGTRKLLKFNVYLS